MPISETLLPEFDQEMANTRKILALVPDGQFDYAPHEKSMKLGRLASHVGEFPNWAKTALETELLELKPGETAQAPATRQEILEKFDREVVEARALIAAASDENLATMWTLKFGGQVILSLPRSAVLRGMVMNHMIHHRAQLGVYLRLNGIEIPGMYGPSADEAQFWKA